MTLVHFHRFLIFCGIVFCGGYAAWELRAFGRAGSTASLLLALVFAALAVALSVYLWKLNRWLGRTEEKEPRSR